MHVSPTATPMAEQCQSETMLTDDDEAEDQILIQCGKREGHAGPHGRNWDGPELMATMEWKARD